MGRQSPVGLSVPFHFRFQRYLRIDHATEIGKLLYSATKVGDSLGMLIRDQPRMIGVVQIQILFPEHPWRSGKDFRINQREGQAYDILSRPGDDTGHAGYLP